MTGCPHSEELVEAIVAGTSASRMRSLEEHARTCEQCRGVLQAHRAMEQIVREVVEPAETDFETVRANVRTRSVETREDRRRWGGLRRFLATARMRPAPAVILAAALLAASFIAGRESVLRFASRDDSLPRAVNERSGGTVGLADYWDSPFTYANVMVRRLDGDRLSLDFDVCRHVSVVADRESNLAREVVLHAILDRSPMNARLKAVELAGGMDDGELREGVILALHHDPELAVRLAALDVLAQSPFDATVKAALLRTLAEDVAVQMRLRALQVLGNSHVGPDVLRRTIVDSGRESDRAVLQRAEELIRESEEGGTDGKKARRT